LFFRVFAQFAAITARYFDQITTEFTGFAKIAKPAKMQHVEE
jgi:hypothetical protein